MPTWLTVAALSARLGVAQSTIRHWRDMHAEYVQAVKDERGHQTYDLERVEEIAVLYGQQRLTQREVQAELARRHGGRQDRPAPAETDALAQKVDRLLALVERIAAHLGVPLDDDRNASRADAPISGEE